MSKIAVYLIISYHVTSHIVPGEVVFSSPAPVCTENRLRWDLTPEQIQQLSEKLVDNTKKVYDRVGAQDLESVTFENTLKVLADVEVEYTGELTCMHHNLHAFL